MVRPRSAVGARQTPGRLGLTMMAVAPAVALVAALMSGPVSNAAPASNGGRGMLPAKAYVPHQVLVRFRSGVDATAIARIDGTLGAATVKRFTIVPGLRLLQLRPSASVPGAVASLGRLPEVLYAQPNWISRIADARPPAALDTTPNDPRYGNQWDWPKLEAPKAWNLTTGSKAVVVGDIDTGLDYRHEDLKANAWKNTRECRGRAGVDDDGNGYVDDCHGIDTINGDSNPMDDNGHGTHTGGTIGAVGDNGIGVTGFNWVVKVLPCKSHDSGGSGSVASIIECYQYMVTEKAAGNDIIATNNSYGGCPEACDFNRATLDGIKGLDKAGILFAVAAGNSGSDNDVHPVYPANYFVPNIISTAATNRTDGLASFSSYGDRSVMVGAPGVSVLSTLPNNSYGNLSGTSMASPHVAGLAALLHAFNPDWTEYQIRNLIISGGDDVASLLGNTLSGKRIDALGSIQCTSAPVFGLLRPLDTVTLKKQTVAALNVDCADGAGALTVTIKPGGIQLRLRDNGVKPDQAANDGIYSASWTPAAKGTYTLKFADGSSYTVVVA